MTDRAQFHAERQRMIGGSDAPAVVGESPFKGAYQVWAEKRGLVPPDDLEGEHLELGLVLEPYVAGKFQRLNPGLTVVAGHDHAPGALVMHPEFSWCGCHIDAVILGDPRGIGNMQIKATGFDDADWKSGAPDHVILQTQHEMACLGASWGVIAVLFGAPVLHTRFVELERNDDLLEVLLDAEAELWRKVESGEEPKSRGIDIPTLKKMYPSVLSGAGEEIELPEDATRWHDDYVRGAALEKDGKRLKDDAKAELLRAIGPAGRGVLPGVGRGAWRRKLIEKDAYLVEAQSYVDLRWVKR